MNLSAKSSLFVRLLAFPAIAIVILVLLAFYRETGKKNQIQDEIDAMREKAEQIDKENGEIKEKISYLESSSYQKKEAKEKLNLQEPGEKVVVIKPNIATEPAIEDEAPEIPVARPDPPISNPLKWWNYFFRP